MRQTGRPGPGRWLLMAAAVTVLALAAACGGAEAPDEAGGVEAGVTETAQIGPGPTPQVEPSPQEAAPEESPEDVGQEVDTEAIAGTFVAELPAAGIAEQRLQLDLAADGVAQLTTDPLSGEPARIEIGTWQAYPDGTLTVVLTTRIGAPSEGPPTTFVLSVEGDTLVATEYDAEAIGADALKFTRARPE